MIQVFRNKQVLVTLTDNDKFGSTVSTKKVEASPDDMAQFDFVGDDELETV